MNFHIREAKQAEAGELSELALRSKAMWGYSSEFIEACRDELTVKGIGEPELWCFVVESEEGIAGFYSLSIDEDQAELEAMFVEPEMTGNKLGKLLLEHAKGVALQSGCRTLVIESDPYAAGFYENSGAKRVGEVPSGSIPGRVLPKYEVRLN